MEKKDIRLNASPSISKKVREIQADYEKRFAPAKVSLDALCNRAMELGMDNLKKQLNLK